MANFPDNHFEENPVQLNYPTDPPWEELTEGFWDMQWGNYIARVSRERRGTWRWLTVFNVPENSYGASFSYGTSMALQSAKSDAERAIWKHAGEVKS